MADGDLALDVNGDQLFDSTGDSVQLKGVQAVAEDVRRRILFFLGEYFLDVEGVGVPWIQHVFGQKNPDLTTITSDLTTAILGAPDMLTLDALDLEFDTTQRTMQVGWQGTTSFGQTPYLTVGVPAPA